MLKYNQSKLDILNKLIDSLKITTQLHKVVEPSSGRFVNQNYLGTLETGRIHRAK